MAIDAQGWADWAIRLPGPSWKQNGGVNDVRLFVAHSAEGSWAGMRSVLFGERRASWHFSNLKDGTLVQHYPVRVQAWASGSWYPNSHGIPMESEGDKDEPLNSLQVGNTIRLLQDLSDYKGGLIWRRPSSRTDTSATVYEHNECTRWGSPATACPSGRYPWDLIIPAANKERLEELDMTVDEFLETKIPVLPDGTKATIRECLLEGYWARTRAEQHAATLVERHLRTHGELAHDISDHFRQPFDAEKLLGVPWGGWHLEGVLGRVAKRSEALVQHVKDHPGGSGIQPGDLVRLELVERE